MTAINYCDLVKETLTGQWPFNSSEPLRIDEADLEAGIALFAKIAVAITSKEEAIVEGSLDYRVSVAESSMSTVDKIKEFISANFYKFGNACREGFFFSRLDSSLAESVLQHALYSARSMIFHWMTLENPSWMPESELNSRFGENVQLLETSVVGEACFDFKRAYREGDYRSGYYLLWLIKQAAGCSYEMPEVESFTDLTVSEFLTGSSGTIRSPKKFVEILCFQKWRSDKTLFQEFLTGMAYSSFIDFAVVLLRCISLEDWPSKACIMVTMFETLTNSSRLIIANELAASEDLMTSKVGTHIAKALEASSFKEAIPHLYALTEAMPSFSPASIESIFAYPFSGFRGVTWPDNDRDFTKCVNFCKNEVFVHGSLMIGVYKPGNIVNSCLYLLAYNRNTEKMVWGIPLSSSSLGEDLPGTFSDCCPRGYHLKHIGEQIFLCFQGSKKVHLIHVETGEVSSILEMPEAFDARSVSCFHISQDFAYQVVDRGQNWVLLGGKIVNNCCERGFEIIKPRGEFRLYATHVGFYSAHEKKLVLVNSTGSFAVIENCLAALARDNKLYSLEKSPHYSEENKHCILRVRTLKDSDDVLSDVEREISDTIRASCFGSFCENGQLILFLREQEDFSPVFIDLESGSVTYSRRKVPSYDRTCIDERRGTVWYWDQEFQKLRKISSVGITTMGILKGSGSTTLLHVDESEHLYYM
ncbi:MAG: hypothetical protein P4L16_04570 [Chlamydiales bacterium]|nr:hypothetical protein [Chlamydiales bacterium]